MLYIVFFIFQIAFSSIAYASDYESTVIETSEYHNKANQVDEFTQDEIQSSDHQRIFQVLGSTSGIDIRNQGGDFKSSSIYIRGGNSSHLLATLDGMKLNDPSYPSRNFDYTSIEPSLIGGLNFIRGPQSVEYGSDAMSGVLEFKSPGFNTENQFKSHQELGSFNTYSTSFQFISSDQKKLKYLVHYSVFSTDSYPMADQALGNKLNNPSSANSGFSKFQYDFNKDHQLNFIYYNQDIKTQLDSKGGINADDPNYFSRSIHENYYVDQKTSLHLDSSFEIKFMPYIQVQNGQRNSQNNSDILNPDTSHSEYESKFIQSGFKVQILKDSTTDFKFGWSWQQEQMSSVSIFNQYTDKFDSKNAHENSYFINLNQIYKNLFMDIGTSFTNHSEYGQNQDFKLSPGIWLIPELLKMRSSYATAHKSPSLYQLYSTYGNKSLQPEKTQSYELGYDFYLKSFQFIQSVFYTNYTNLIDYDFTKNQYFNLNQSKIQGFETNLKVQLWHSAALKLSHTYLEAKDLVQNTELLRRPRNIYKLVLQTEISRLLQLDLFQSWVDESSDLNPNNSKKEILSSYSTTDLILRYNFFTKMDTYLSLHNIFNSNYEVIDGYGSEKRSVFVGMHLSY